MDIAVATRPVQDDDLGRFLRLWPRLSPETRYRRFHSPVHRLPMDLVRRLVHVDQIDVRKITRGDFQVISYLKTREPQLYKRLRQQATTGSSSVHKRSRHR